MFQSRIRVLDPAITAGRAFRFGIWSRRRWWRPPANGVSSHSVEDFVRQAEGDDAAAHREDVRVVVLARQPRGEQVVAERGANAGDLVGGNLFALAAAAEHDAAVGASFDDRASDRHADGRIVDRRLAVGAVILDGVPEPLQRLLEVLFEEKPGVIGADRHAHPLILPMRSAAGVCPAQWPAGEFVPRGRVRVAPQTRSLRRSLRIREYSAERFQTRLAISVNWTALTP